MATVQYDGVRSLHLLLHPPHKNGKKNSLKGRTYAGWRKMLVLNAGEKAHDQKIMGYFKGLVLQMWSQRMAKVQYDGVRSLHLLLHPPQEWKEKQPQRPYACRLAQNAGAKRR